MKKCFTCGISKPVSDFYFSKKITNSQGLSSNCKGCTKKIVAQWKKNNPKKVIESRLTYNKNHKKQNSEYYKKWYKINGRKTRRAMRFAILSRDNFTCQYCGQKAPDVRLEVDHVFPKSRGGKNEMSNYKTACWDCNRGKYNSVLTKIDH
jgi:5-methylcytosine-specific restriction endonuclease McrA